LQKQYFNRKLSFKKKKKKKKKKIRKVCSSIVFIAGGYVKLAGLPQQNEILIKLNSKFDVLHIFYTAKYFFNCISQNFHLAIFYRTARLELDKCFFEKKNI